MIDWFASKIGLLAFVVVVASALIGFTFMQVDVYKSSVRVQALNDLAKLADSAFDGMSYEYAMDIGNYSLEVRSRSVMIGSAERRFVSEAEPVNITDAAKITVSRSGGKVRFNV